MKRAAVWLGVPCFLLSVLLLIMHLCRWEFLYIYPLAVSLALAATIFFTVKRIRVFVREFRENKGLERWRQCLGTAIIALAILTLGMAISIVFAQTGAYPVGFYHSPDAKQELVVCSSDGVYTARPSLIRLFYKSGSNGYVSHFDKRCSDIQVRWLDDGSAQVYFVFDPSIGPVEQDSIHVIFD